MKSRHLLVGTCVLAGTSIASADVLAASGPSGRLGRGARRHRCGSSPVLVRHRGGRWDALDADAKENDAQFRFKGGIGLNVGVGYAFAKDWAIEFHSGLLWNEIDDVGGSVRSVGGATYQLGGGTGHVYQVPWMASVVYSLHFTDTFAIGIKAGAGIQWTDVNVEDIAVFGPGAPATTFGYDNRSTAFRWEVGFRIANQIAPNVRVGGGVMFSGTSEVDLGAPGYAGGPAFLPGGSTNLESLYNVSLGFGVNITF